MVRGVDERDAVAVEAIDDWINDRNVQASLSELIKEAVNEVRKRHIKNPSAFVASETEVVRKHIADLLALEVTFYHLTSVGDH